MTVRAVVEANPRLDLPGTVRVVLTVRLVVEASVIIVVDAKMFCEKILRKRRALVPITEVLVTSGTISLKDEVAAPTERPYDGVVDPIPTLPLDPMLKKLDPDDDATVKILERDPDVPTTESLEYGVEDPTPMFPPAKIVNIDTPEEDATLNGLSGDDVDDCTLKVKDEEDALIPRTEPLSIKVEVPRVLAVNQRVAHPKDPPETPVAVIPREEVDTHSVEVPVAQRS